MAWLCQPWLTTTNPSYRFPIFETSATTLCGTTGTEKMHTNQTNIDAQQNTTAKKCAFWSALTENQCQLLQLVTWKIKHMHHLAGPLLKWKELEFSRSAAETRWVCDFSWIMIRLTTKCKRWKTMHSSLISGIYLKITTNIYLFFKRILKGLFSNPLFF